MNARILAIAALVASTAVSLGAQAPAAAAPAPAPPAEVPVPALEPQGYTYNADGRRDPFVSLVRRTAEGSAVSNSPRPRGLAGLSSGELTLRGIVKGPAGFVAMAKAVDNRTYLLRAGDKLYDGVVRAVTADGIIVLQDVSDPLSPVTRREVRKPLRPTQEAH
jgi:Tfp pilus assembly protein PilP